MMEIDLEAIEDAGSTSKQWWSNLPTEKKLVQFNKVNIITSPS
jgi:hypothetical protein